MSKFDELKKLAEAATVGVWTAEPPAEDFERDGGEQYHWSVRAPYPTSLMISYQLCKLSSLNNNEEEDAAYIAAANPAAILELLAIQAQLVEALKGLDDSFCSINEFSTKEERHQARMNLMAARAAVAAVEVKP